MRPTSIVGRSLIAPIDFIAESTLVCEKPPGLYRDRTQPSPRAQISGDRYRSRR